MTKGYLLFPKHASRYNSRRFPQHGNANVAYKEDGDTPPVLTAELIMKELGNMKEAVVKKMAEDVKGVEKNLDEKLGTINEAIETLKAVKPEVTAAELKSIKDDVDVTLKAFDKLQTRMKADSMSRPGGREAGDSFDEKLKAGILSLKDNLHGDQIKSGKFITPIQLKAVGDMTVAANVNTGVVPNTYRSGIVPVPFEMVHLRDLVNVTPSETDSYHFYRHTIGEGTIEFQTQENETKAQIDEDLLEQTVNLNYLAGWLRISKKMLRNFKGLQGYLSRWLPERYYEREDTKGYQVLISGATGVADTSGTSASGGMIQQIVRTIGLQKKAKYNVNGIVIDGAVWANILTYKDSTGGFNALNVLSVSTTGQLMLLGIPIYTASWVGSDEAIVGDWRYFEIIQSEALSLQFFDQDGTNVRKNKITVRIEASVGFALLDPKAFAVVSLEAVS